MLHVDGGHFYENDTCSSGKRVVFLQRIMTGGHYSMSKNNPLSLIYGIIILLFTGDIILWHGRPLFSSLVRKGEPSDFGVKKNCTSLGHGQRNLAWPLDFRVSRTYVLIYTCWSAKNGKWHNENCQFFGQPVSFSWYSGFFKIRKENHNAFNYKESYKTKPTLVGFD